MTPRKKHLYKSLAQTIDTEVRAKSMNDLRLFNTTEEFHRYIRYSIKRQYYLGEILIPHL